MKLILLTLSFDIREWHTMFMKYYKEIDKDHNMTFDIDEITSCFELFSKNEMLGKKRMTNVLN